MKVFDALERALEAHFGRRTSDSSRALHVVTEPSNAMARREIRIMPTAQRLAQADAVSAWVAYTPYELVIDVTISVRLSGGNSNKLLTSEAMLHAITLQELLTQRLMVLKDIGEPLPDMRADMTAGWQLAIVGDAELTGAKRLASGFAGSQQGPEFEQRKDDLYTWREDWQASLVMTVHRTFPNPRLQQMVFTEACTGHEIVVPTHEPKEA